MGILHISIVCAILVRTFYEIRRAVGMLNLCVIKIQGTYRGEMTTPENIACPEAGK